MIHAAEFPDAAVGFEPLFVVQHVLVQVEAGGLFFALDDKLDAAWQVAILIQQGVDGEQAAGDVPLVVADAAPVEFAAAQGWLEGRRLPQLQRLGRLDIVVVVEQQRFVAFALALAKDDRRAVGGHDISREAAFAQHPGDQFSALFYSQVLRADRGLCDQSG